ncbi:hypothetical protein BGW39_008920, partial [Mortierella sp. 14UC]
PTLFPTLQPANNSNQRPKLKQQQQSQHPYLRRLTTKRQVIPMDVLLSEIPRLIAHEFGGPIKAAPYPTVLKASLLFPLLLSKASRPAPLYQRLRDYHVLLKNARRKLDQHQ